MKQRSSWLAGYVIAALVASVACDKRADAPKATPPATVTNPATESTLSTITLTPAAEARLGIAVATAAVESISKTRTLGGEVMVPPGRSVIVSAPIGATVQAGAVSRPGVRVERGQTLFTLFPLSSTERDQRVIAQRDVASASAELQAAEQRLARLESLLKDGATSARAVEEARAQREVLAAAATAGRARVENMRGGAVGARGEIAVRAPLTGVLQEVHAASGQSVAAGAPLFSVAQDDAMWVRVAVYVGDRDAIDGTQPAAIFSLGGGGAITTAARVNAPASANPLASTADLFYAPVAVTDRLHAGDRVNVQLPLRDSQSALVVPAAAIVYDMQGGTWVYVALGDHRFARRRVDVKGQSGARTIIERGLQSGQKVVTDGAAELFGTEFGAGK
ncbi:MAG: efflux RND transporter periplasmic adaptor subunit [Vicinamibacterales bacterium]